MDISLDKDVDATNAVELDLFVLVVPPIAHPGHIYSTGVILLVA
jgi:hypothetical protein